MVNFDEIKKQFKGEVETDQATLAKNSRDASIFEIMPKCVAHPKDADDLKNLVKWVNRKINELPLAPSLSNFAKASSDLREKEGEPRLSITARSAGTDMGGGAINDSIIADFTAHFNHIEMFGADFAVVEPGVYYRDFEVETLKRGLILPCYTASKSLNTVGGMAANNSAGEKSLSYGQTKDYVEELNIVLSDGNEYTFGELNNHQLEQKLRLTTFEGEIYRKMFRLIKENNQLIKKARPTTSKNSAGYLLWEVWDGARFNLAKLICGSQGTLGLVTKIKYRLVRPKPKSELLVIFMKDLANLGEVVRAVANHNPESFESFDDHTFKLAMKFMPDMIKRMKGNILTLGLQFLPELWMTITGGVPKLILIAEFTGETEEEVLQKLLLAQTDVKTRFKLKTHVTKNVWEAQKYWIVRRESFNLLRQHTHGLSTAPFIDDIIVHPDQLPQFLPELNAIFAKYPSLIYTIAGHVGDANFHIIPLMDLTKAGQRMIIPKLANEVYDLVLKYRGSITAEHNDGLIRSPFLEKMFGPEVTALFRQTKEIFDPKNIFNPRKKVGATLEYAMAHIKKTL